MGNQGLETADFQVRFPDETTRVIRGRVTRPTASAPLPAVIVVHGFKGFLRWGFFPDLQERIARRGMVSVAINLSGSGVGDDLESFTDDNGFFRSTPSRDVEDVEVVRRLIDEGAEPALRAIDSTRLALFGHSRGGGTVLLHAERRGDYRGVVTWASVGSTDRFDEATKAAWRAAGVLEVPNARTGQVHRISTAALDDARANAEALDIQAACARSSTPTLLIHGTADESVSFDEARELEAAFDGSVGELLVIDGAGHTFGAVHPYRGATPDLERAFDATLAFLEGRLLS